MTNTRDTDNNKLVKAQQMAAKVSTRCQQSNEKSQRLPKNVKTFPVCRK